MGIAIVVLGALPISFAMGLIWDRLSVGRLARQRERIEESTRKRRAAA